jgi:ribosomal protein S18 acetylase RimI-like enzyme
MVNLPLTSLVIIRLATAEDLPDLEWGGELIHFRRIFADAYHLMQSGEVMMWVVDMPGQGVIGQLFVHLYGQAAGMKNGRPYAYIYGFRVQPAYRNLGVGSRLLQTAEFDLAENGFCRVTLNVARDNPGARRLYERFGYRIVAPEPGIWSYLDQNGERVQVNEPAWRMEKEI